LLGRCVLQQFIHPNAKSLTPSHSVIPYVREEQAYILIPANLWHKQLSAVDTGTLFSKSMQVLLVRAGVTR
jgi:hypothetical protein